MSSRPMPYPTMSIEQIRALPIAALAAQDAHLYLWAVNAHVASAYEMVRAWGFKPSTLLVWAKNPMGGGLGSNAYGLSTEFILFARRGRLRPLSRVGRSWFNWKRPYNERGKPRHSAKPPEFYAMVEEISPAPRLELFARERRGGWSVWGDQVESDIEVAVNSL